MNNKIVIMQEHLYGQRAYAVLIWKCEEICPFNSVFLLFFYNFIRGGGGF